jgi:hypothetical protein
VIFGGLFGLFLATVGLMAYLGTKGPQPGPTPSPGGPDPGVGDAASGGQGQDVDGIKCETHEQLAYHVHAHISILVNGQPQLVSQQIGIPGGPGNPRCYYWLHTHDTTGIIHIESPTQSLYTLGQFFDIWGQPLNRSNVAVYPVPGGDLTAYVDGQAINGDPRDIQLKGHTQVVLQLGSQVQPSSYSFPPGD